VRKGRLQRLRGLDETLTAQPGYALVGVVRVPEAQVSPMRAIWRRVAIALLTLVVAVVTTALRSERRRGGKSRGSLAGKLRLLSWQSMRRK